MNSNIYINNFGEMAIRTRTSGEMGWEHVPPATPAPFDPDKDQFYKYLKDTFGLTEEEFIEILKKEHPEVLI